MRRYENVSIEKLKPYKNNARTHSEEQVNKIANSIKEFGFVNPVLIDSNFEIIAGHGRVMGAKQLGMQEVPCIFVEDLTETQKRAYILADNKLALDAGWDNDILLGELEALKELNFDITLAGFDTDEIKVDIEPQEETQSRLADKFIIPPFDVFDAKTADWLNRKRLWNNLIQDNAQARANAKAYENKVMNDKSKYKHNGIMQHDVSILDPVLSEIIISWFTPKESNNLIFDCFAGDTVFGYVAQYKGNEFVGIELRQEQVDFNNQRTNNAKCKYICDDAQNVDKHIEPNSQDLFFSCPPYFDLEVYSDLKNDASNQGNFEDFYKILDNAFTKSIKCLKDNRFAVVVVGDVRNKKTGEYYNLPNRVIETFVKNGMALYNNIKLLTPFGNAQIRCARNMRNRKTVHVYQDVLVFYKGDTKQISANFGEVEVAEIESENLEF